MIDIQSGIAAVLAGKRKLFPCHTNRASSIDDPCERRLFYRRTAWDKAAPVPDSLQGVFATGNILEPVIERIASEVGQASTPPWRIVGSQMPTNSAALTAHEITGSIDGLLQVQEADGRWVTVGVVDVKTMSGNVYPQIDTYDDLSKYPWTKGYRGQLMVYAVGHGLERCYILAVNKNSLFDMKLITFQVDPDYVQRLFDKADRVNAAIKANEPPDGVNDPAICTRCPWFAFCAPPVATGGNLEIIDNGELEEVLSRMEELQPTAKEYDDLEKARDLMLTKGKDVVVGSFMVMWKKTRGGQWRKRIARMGGTVAEKRQAVSVMLDQNLDARRTGRAEDSGVDGRRSRLPVSRVDWTERLKTAGPKERAAIEKRMQLSGM